MHRYSEVESHYGLLQFQRQRRTGNVRYTAAQRLDLRAIKQTLNPGECMTACSFITIKQLQPLLPCLNPPTLGLTVGK